MYLKKEAFRKDMLQHLRCMTNKKLQSLRRAPVEAQKNFLFVQLPTFCFYHQRPVTFLQRIRYMGKY